VQRHQPVLIGQRGVIAASVASWNSAHRRGATLAVTEMHPTPPWALKASAVASSPDKLDEILAAGGALLADAFDLAGGILDPDDARQFGQRTHGFGRHVHHRPAGDVVDDDRQVQQSCSAV
jgi:hypothetical protein